MRCCGARAGTAPRPAARRAPHTHSPPGDKGTATEAQPELPFGRLTYFVNANKKRRGPLTRRAPLALGAGFSQRPQLAFGKTQRYGRTDAGPPRPVRDAGRSRPAALCHAAERRPAHSPPSGRSSARRHSGGRARGPALGSEGAGYAGAARSSRAAGRAVPLPARGKGRGRPRTPQRTATPARPRLRAPGTGAQSSPRTRPPCPHRGRQPPRESAAPPPGLHLPPRAPQPGAAPSTAAQPRPAALTFRRRPGNGVERRSPPPFRHWLQRRSAARGMAAAHVSRGAGIRVAPPRFRPRALLEL